MGRFEYVKFFAIECLFYGKPVKAQVRRIQTMGEPGEAPITYEDGMLNMLMQDRAPEGNML